MTLTNETNDLFLKFKHCVMVKNFNTTPKSYTSTPFPDPGVWSCFAHPTFSPVLRYLLWDGTKYGPNNSGLWTPWSFPWSYRIDYFLMFSIWYTTFVTFLSLLCLILASPEYFPKQNSLCSYLLFRNLPWNNVWIYALRGRQLHKYAL